MRRPVTRRRLLQAGAGLAAAAFFDDLILPAPAAAQGRGIPRRIAAGDVPLSSADYLRYADRVAARLDSLWELDRHSYNPRAGGVDTVVNAALLTVHSVAALAEHDGPARQDQRAALIARRLVESPPWRETGRRPAGDNLWHLQGWTTSLHGGDNQDPAVDAKTVEGLFYAWRAREVLDLPRTTVVLLEDRIVRCARGGFWAWPRVLLNQINWNAELWTYAVGVSGDPTLLRHDYRQALAWFVDRIRHAGPSGTRFLNGGFGFHYLPHGRVTHPLNVDAAEYANIAIHALLHYDKALAAGMAPLPRADVALLREWVRRVLCGYWTHGGYLNWDTGFGYKRWHYSKYWALAQQGLLAIAAADRFQPSPEYGRWAKYAFDRALVLFERLSREEGDRLPPANLYGVDRWPQGTGAQYLYVARMAANAVRAYALGLGERGAEEPPALYSFDPDTGRLAVTTREYNTAVTPVGMRGLPYGGNELARLYDADQRVVAGVGGKPPAAFGVVVTNARGREVAASQRGRDVPSREGPDLELTRSPRGRVGRRSHVPQRAYAGPFERIEAVGRRTDGGVRITTVHDFRPDLIETTWRVTPLRRAQRRVDVHFPSWGRDARVVTVAPDGTRTELSDRAAAAVEGEPSVATAASVTLDGVAWFWIDGEESGYVIVPGAGGSLARARILRPRPQHGAPRPGPTLALRLERNAAGRPYVLTVRLAVARSAEAAEEAARRLGADVPTDEPPPAGR